MTSKSNSNLILPSRLDGAGSSHNPENTESLNLKTLTEQITTIVKEMLTQDREQTVNNHPNLSGDDDQDQIININTDRNLADMDKIPDVVKSLREFSGQPGEFSSWKKSVDRILTIYEHLKGTPKYYGILSVIRNKIVGHADIALESYNTPLNWRKISKCLTLHYADKRDLGTLEYQMTTLVQGTQTASEFYQMVYQHLSLILNKLSCMEMSRESLNNMTQAYRDKALDTFVRGLKGDLPRLLSIKEPEDQPQALHLCLKLQNVDYRTQYANSSQNTLRRSQQPPPIPRRNIPYNSIAPIPAPRNSFFPELAHNPTQPPRPYFQRPYQSPSFRPPHQLPPRPMPRPEPMDVDRSIQSRQLNYVNRPPNHQFNRKRYPFNNSYQAQPPNKFQRTHHITHGEEEITTSENKQNTDYQDDQNNQNYQNDQTSDSYETNNFDSTEELEDIYFLD